LRRIAVKDRTVIGRGIDVSGRKGSTADGLSTPIVRSWRISTDIPPLPDVLSPLWIGGLSLVLVTIAYVGLGGPSGLLPRKLFDWSLYLALGGSFALSTILAYATRTTAWSASWLRWLLGSLSAAALFGLSALVLIPDRWIALPLAGVQIAWTAWLARRRNTLGLLEFVLLAVVAVLGWTAVAPLMWWETLPERIAQQPLAVVVVALALAGVTTWAMPPAAAWRDPSRPVPAFRRGIDVVAIALIAILAFRTDGLFLAGEPWGALHHWGVFVGPAQEIRDGGFLLWDVPAQYGFLSILLLAASPVASLWQALYVWNSLSLFLVALAIYLVLRAVRPDWIGQMVALGAAVAGVFLATTWAATLSPIHYHPSFGPYRYVWCFALLAALVVAARQPVGSRSEAIALVAGNVCWLLGVYWSFESAVFSSVIWFPAYFLIVAERTNLLPSYLAPPPYPVGADQGSAARLPAPEAQTMGGRGAVLHFAAWTAAPPLMLAAALILTALVYVRELGHLPDHWSYVEYVASFGSGYVSQIAGETLVLDPADAHLAIALALVIVFSCVAIHLRHPFGARVVPLLIALGTAVWLVSSYSIGRPDPHTVSRSWPFFLIAVGVALILLDRRTDWKSGSTIRAASVPLVAMLLILTYTNFAALQWHVSALELPGQRVRQVEQGLPVADERLARLLENAGVTTDSPVIFDGSPGGNLMPMWTAAPDGELVTLSRSWVPAPLTGLIVLQEDRRQTYMGRMIDRRQSGGWYIHRADDRDVRGEQRWAGAGQWFFDQLARTHVPTRSYQNNQWQLVWFEYVGDAPGMQRPLIVGGQLHESPDQLWINRRPINSGQDFGIWMIPGPGWGNDGSTRDLSLSFPATTSIYSDRDRDVTVKLTSGKRFRLPELEVVHDGAAVGRVRRAGETAGLFDLSLRQGWNEVEFRLLPGQSPDGAADEQSRQAGVEIARIDIVTRGERQR
jgi:hypothetical protein